MGGAGAGASDTAGDPALGLSTLRASTYTPLLPLSAPPDVEFFEEANRRQFAQVLEAELGPLLEALATCARRPEGEDGDDDAGGEGGGVAGAFDGWNVSGVALFSLDEVEVGGGGAGEEERGN